MLAGCPVQSHRCYGFDSVFDFPDCSASDEGGRELHGREAIPCAQCARGLASHGDAATRRTVRVLLYCFSSQVGLMVTSVLHSERMHSAFEQTWKSEADRIAKQDDAFMGHSKSLLATCVKTSKSIQFGNVSSTQAVCFYSVVIFV